VFIVRSPLAIFLLYSTAFVTALFALYGSDIQDLAYLHSRQTNLWRMLTALMPTAWVLTLAILFGDFERSRAAWPRTRRALRCPHPAHRTSAGAPPPRRAPRAGLPG
jgi:hypothetical protein